jgi:hypothetical protein
VRAVTLQECQITVGGFPNQRDREKVLLQALECRPEFLGDVQNYWEDIPYLDEKSNVIDFFLL